MKILSCPQVETITFPDGPLVLGENELHLWWVFLEKNQEEYEVFSKTLSVDEQKRADRFQFNKDKQKFVISHGILRSILSSYLSCLPQKISFKAGEFGKPFVEQEGGEKIIHFNMSHSHGLALYAFAWNFQVGVDVEKINPQVDFLGIVNRFFSKREQKMFDEAKTQNKPQTFFNIWTCKEAYLKACGSGLKGGLDSIEVDINVAGKISDVRFNDEQAGNWSLIPMQSLQPDYAGCVVVEGEHWQPNHIKLFSV